MASDLETCCVGLSSTKVTERKKNADLLHILMDNKGVLRILNDENSHITWDIVVASVHKLLIKEVEKYEEDERKKKSCTSIYNFKKGYGDLLILVIRKANTKGSKLKVSKLIQYVTHCFNSLSLKKYFRETYIVVLKDYILSVKKYRGDITSNEWLDLLDILKTLYRDPLHGVEDLKVLQCLQLLLHWGPLHRLPCTNLRQEFPFITQVAQRITSSSPRLQQEIILGLLLKFCFQTAEDNRMACCKLGEELSNNFIGIYQAHSNNNIKKLILKFFLLQVQIHHPNGAVEGSISSYAYSWLEWNKQLRSVYSILCHEMDDNIQINSKPSTLFGGQKNFNVLPKPFVTLFVELFKQILASKGITALDVSQTSDSSQPASKRKKIEDGFYTIISNIQESKDWPWISVVAELLTRYPDLISSKDFVYLLRVLSAQQAECKSSNIRYHLYNCLSILVDVETHIDVAEYSDAINSLWSVIWECTLRAVGLNENEENTHKLLQKLISKRKTMNSIQLFRTYMSQVLNVSKYSLETLNIACARFDLPQRPLTVNINSENNHKTLLKWILNANNEKLNNTDVFSERITAEVLLFLTFKQWPEINAITYNRDFKYNGDGYKYKTIEYVYSITSFDGGLVLNKDEMQINETTVDNIINSSQSDNINLNELLHEFAGLYLQHNARLSVAIKNTVNIIVLLANTLTLMIDYNLLQEEQVVEHKLTKMLLLLLERWWDLFKTLLGKLNEKKTNIIVEVLQQIKKLFTAKLQDTLFLILRKNIPIEFIKTMFDLLNQEESSQTKVEENEAELEDEKKVESDKLSMAALEILCCYCCVPNMACTFDTQQQALETLAEPNFDPELSTDYEMAMTFLLSLENFKPGTLSDNVLEKILKSIQLICQVCYTNYKTALNILKILHNLYPHVALTNNDDLKENAVLLLYPFYQQRNDYGPNVSTALLDCMGQLSMVDPHINWAKWHGNEHVIAQIPNLLSSDYQQVRLAAIKNIHIVFLTSCKNDLQLVHQNALFNTIAIKCVEVFNVDGSLSEERKVDETVTRTASALHTLATVIATNVILRQKSLFMLLQLMSEKSLNIDSTLRVLEMVAKHLCIRNAYKLIEINLNYLISQWHSNNYDLKDFPYILLGCSSKIEFCAKYISAIVPVLIAKDLPLLEEVCNHSEKSIQEIVEISYPNIIARCFLISTRERTFEGDIKQDEIAYKNACLENLANILTSDRVDELIIEKLHEIISSLLQFCFDPEHLTNTFTVHYPLPEPFQPYFTTNVVLKTISDIENKYLHDDLISYCISNCPAKLQELLLNLIAPMHTSTSTEDKVKTFLQCTILIDLIVPYLKENNEFRVYFIRTISYTLIHLIRYKYEDDSIMNRMSCKYFSTFLGKILPENADVLNMFLVTFVSILIPIAKCNNHVGLECAKLLNLMIVDYVNDLVEAIEMLDPFPQEEKFSRMQNIYKKVKYEKKMYNLENEMQNFLDTSSLMGNAGCRTEGLKHLKNQLSCKKMELKEIYSKLHDVRGFSEDCEKSVLHRLICVLIKLSLSSDSHESREATRCLGELGSADLLTTVLQAEQQREYENCNAFELVTGCVTALLAKYIVDSDVRVMQVSSEALYYVLDCKEGKAVLASKIDYGYGKIDKSYVTPFISSRKLRSDSSFSQKNNFENLINSNVLWCPEVPTEHGEWITQLVCTMLETFTDKCYLSNLIPVCKAKVEFSEHLLPLLVYLILSSRYAHIVSAQIQRFFESHWTLSLHPTNTDSIAVNKLSVQCMLNVVHFIRLRKNIESNRSFGDLSLNYLYVAQAAQFCTAQFTALLYVELWSQERLKEIRTSTKSAAIYTSGVTPLDIIFQQEQPDIQQALQNILREGYKRVGELDALRTCETIGPLDSRLRVDHYEHLQRWEQVTLLYDIQISQGNTTCIPSLIDALKNCSLYQLPLKYDISVESQFECAWRLSNWSINKTDSEKSENYEKYKYFAMKALHDDDTSNFNCAISDARNSVINCLRHASLESSQNLYEPLNQLQSIQELEDFLKAQNEGNFKLLLEKWNVQDEINRNEFQYLEPILAQRIVTVKNLVSQGNETLKDTLVEMYLKLAGLARAEGKQNIANRALGSLLHVSDLTPEIRNRIMIEEAQLCWLDDKTTARYILRNLLNKTPSPRLHAAALKLCGTWMVETCSENPETIISDYFMESLKILNNLQKTDVDNVNICETYDVLARFADSQYQQVLTYIKSSVFECKVQNMEKANEAAANISKHANGYATGDERRAMITHERQSKIDKAEINNTLKEKNMYLKLAMQYYILNLQFSDINNVRMFRVLSLWLENRNNTEIADLLSIQLPKIVSYKYIPILPQLVPHITSNKEDSFGNQINRIIEKCAVDHPHHTLPVILALANSHKDKKYYKSKTNTSSNEPRIAGAERFIEQFKTQGHPLKQLVIRMEILSHALMELAYLNEEKCKANKQGNFMIPDSSAVTKIKKFDNVLLPTYNMPVKRNCDYTNIIGIYSFGKTFVNAGGLNAPKRVTCIGTDGETRVQLVKGKDDLRQDAVMQQVFNIMNELLRSNKQTSKLLIRTYKIVPLSQRSGILEWVANSMPLSDYLVGKDKKPGAHQRYNRNDITPAQCRNEFKNIARLPNNDKLRIYKDICRRFQPVFHKFFEESFVQPAIWYERRRAYTCSVATSSMCGYILGLGDRHVLNILIDKITAEVVHIDFGIAFEQGQVLPTPETVPFRLTRDIEAGMGVSGIEGVFRKSCEKTLEVLRKNAETIITILEVLLYDPLYAWTITPAEAYSRQFKDDKDATTSNCIEFSNHENIPVNITAERTLLRLRQKLQGTTEGGCTSIEGQVERLIQQAHDPSNLCRLYQGWQPYL